MTGKLIKLNNKWVIKYVDFGMTHINYYDLHPDDVKRIEQDLYQFDNIEARIVAYPDVEFELVAFHNLLVHTGIKYNEYITYARLIPKTEEKSWNDIHEEYSKDEYPAFGGPFTHAMTFIEWLKLNYNPPIKKSTK